MLASLVGLAHPTAGCGASWPAVDVSSLPGASDHPDADAVILLDEELGRFAWDERADAPVYECDRHKRVRVLTSTGRERWASYAIHYDAELDELLAVRARVLTSAGESKPLTETTDHPVTWSGSLHSSQRVRVIDAGIIGVGDTFEVAYRLRSRTTFRPETFQLAALVPVRLARLELSLRPGQEIATRFTRDALEAELEPQRETLADGSMRLVWAAADVPALSRRGSYLPSFRQSAPTVFFALRQDRRDDRTRRYLDRWADYGPWYADLTAGVFEVTDAVRDAAERVLEGAPDDPLERVRRLFRHVQEDVRYVAVSLGMGGWRPHRASEVAEAQLGDCKDMAAYLKTLLATEGIESHIAELGTRDVHLPLPPEDPGDQDRVNLRHFNHAILAVDLPGRDGPLFLDPTCRACPFGRVRWDDEGVDVLLLEEEGAARGQIPLSAARDNWTRREVRLRVGADLAVEAETRLRAFGHQGTSWRSKLIRQNPREREETIQRLVARRGSVELREQAVERLLDLDEPLEVRGAGSAVDLLEGSGGLVLLAPAALAPVSLRRLVPDRPSLPCMLSYPRTDELRVDVELAEGLRVESLPPDVAVRSEVGHYERRFGHEGRRLTIERSLVLDAVRVPADRVAAFGAFIDAVLDAEAKPAVLRASPAVSSR